MCAAKLNPSIEEELDNFTDILLHKKDLKRKKPFSINLEWMLKQCSLETLRQDDKLFSLLPANPDVLLIDRQTYQQWKSLYEIQKFGHPFRMRRRIILIQPLSYSSSSYSIIHLQILSYLKEFCQAFFYGMEVQLAEPIEISQIKKLTKRIHSETGREQILVDDLMRHLKTYRHAKAFCVVGVTIADLYPGPQWNFTLGHASLTDGVAVCSFGRYFNSQATPTLSVLQQQLMNIWVLVRVLTHEIGHVFGLGHCYFFSCAMNESSSILQAAMQPLFMCPICLRKLQKVLKFDLSKRYQAMAEECAKLGHITATPTGSPESARSGSNHDTTSSISHHTCVPSSTVQLELENPSSHFKKALNWLEKTISSLDQQL